MNSPKRPYILPYACKSPVNERDEVQIRLHLARWEPLCVHGMFSNGVTTQFPFVPSKHILVTFQDLPKLFLLFIHVMINLDLLANFFHLVLTS